MSLMALACSIRALYPLEIAGIKSDSKSKKALTNDQITAPQVRLIDAEGEQVGIVALAVYCVVLIRTLTFSKKSTISLLVISFLLIMAWSFRNFPQKETSFEKHYTGPMEFDHSKIVDSRIPFFTSHLETFLKVIHRTDWKMQTFLLRTDEEDFNELPKFNKILIPSSKKDLAKLDQFIYHYYYSGPHSDIDFNPMEWAIENGYSISEINHYPLVLRFNRN